MRRRIAIAGLALGLVLAAAPMAQARDEGVEVCVALSCDVGFVQANGAIATLSHAIQAGCSASDGVAAAPLRFCTHGPVSSCDSSVVAAGVDGVAAVGARSVGCGEGFDGLVLHLLR
jgi:hypothetical protein